MLKTYKKKNKNIIAKTHTHTHRVYSLVYKQIYIYKLYTLVPHIYIVYNIW